MKYAIILGTRAEYIKMFPVMLELQKRNIEYKFIATGQHKLYDLIKMFNTKAPDIIINSRDGFKGDTGGAFKWALQTNPKLIKYLKNNDDIKYVLVHGDTLSTLIGSWASKISGKKLVHVEAGLRSGNIREPWPEELVRRIVDFISDIKFCPSEKCKKRLGGVSFNVGNTSIDSLYMALSLENHPNIDLPQQFAIASIHRHENIKSPDRMKKILKIIGNSEIPVIWFMHENTKQKLFDYGLEHELKETRNLKIIPSMEYSQFINVLGRAQFVFGDGGSLAEECAELNIPYITLRYETEREELLNRPDQCLTKLDINIAQTVVLKYSMNREYYDLPNPYFTGESASKQIVDILVGMEKNEVSPCCKIETHREIK
jgi:UDP-N-acetylglucosamine 2-epimerase (non-hydrolysing)